MHRPTYRKATLHSRLLAAVLLAAVWDTCTAQGLDLSRARPGLGATWTYDALHAAYSKTRKWQQAYTLAPRATCRNQSGSLCGAVDGSTEFVQLVLAASPSKYDARTDRPGQADAIAPPKDQRLCTTCVAFAVAAGGSAAAATALRVPGATINFSEQDLFSCTWNLLCPWQPNVCGGAGVRLCVQDWDLKPALETLCNRPLARDACLPYNLDQNPEIRRVCDYQCKDSPQPLAAVAGSFSFRELRSDWEIQQHIRRNGAVVTSIDLYNDFKEFFTRNPQGIYPGPRPGAKFEAGHAIALVGYDQVGGYYVVKNSYGPSFAAGGFCKVRFGVANITRPGFTFGITFLPATPPQALLRVTPAPGKPGCYLYKASPKDYMEWLSDQTAIPLQKLLLDNVERVKDIGSIGGITLLLCNPDARNIIVPGQARPTTPAAGPNQPSAAAPATPAPGPSPSPATTPTPSSTTGTSSGLAGLAGLAALGRTAVAAPTANPTNQPPPPKPTGNATPDAGGVTAACEQCTQCSLCSKCTACSKPFALLDWEKDQACRTCAQCSGCPTSLTAPTIGGKRDLTQYGACANCLACAQCCGEGLFGGCKECGPCGACAYCKLNT